jgi:glucokinase
MSLFIGLDLGGTNLKYALGTETGEIIARFSKRSLADQNQEVVFENMFTAVDELLREAERRSEKVNAIGVGSPGCIDFKTGKLLGNAPNFDHWTNAPIKKNFEDRFNLPTYADNDANLMALAEARKGAGQKYNNLLCATLGTGIGGGIIINNELYRGAHYSAAEIGHIVVEYGGKLCNCGNLGCLEAYAAAPAMVERYRRKLKRTGVMFNIDELSTEFIFQKAKVNEDLAKETIIETCDYLGVGLASIVNTIDPDIVILGGGVTEAGTEFIKRIEQVVKQYALKSIAKKLQVVKAELNLDAGIVGAILLAAENFLKKG